MNEFSITWSFIIRVYRYDDVDMDNIVGVIEPIDGSGMNKSFSDSDELLGALRGFLCKDDKE